MRIIGSVFDMKATFNYLAKLRDNDAQCRGAAGLLRTLADMIDGALPTTMVPPDEELP